MSTLVLGVLFAFMTTSANEALPELLQLNEEEFNKLYKEENPDSYFLPILFSSKFGYSDYVKAMNDDEHKVTIDNQIFQLICDESGRITLPIVYDNIGKDEEYCNTALENDLRYKYYFFILNQRKTVEYEPFIRAYLAPWTLYIDGEFYTWNDLLRLSEKEINSIDFSTYAFSKYINNIKSEMEIRSWWKEEYEELYLKLYSHKDDYEQAHKDELYYNNEYGEKIYISEIRREFALKAIDLKTGKDLVNGRNIVNIYSFNPYSNNFYKWFMSRKDELPEDDFKSYFEDFCDNLYPTALPKTHSGTETPFRNLGALDSYGFELYKDYSDGKISKEELEQLYSVAAFKSDGFDENGYYSKENMATYCLITTADSWYDVLKASIKSGPMDYLVILNIEKSKAEDPHFYVAQPFQVSYSSGIFTDEQLSLIDDPERVISDLEELKLTYPEKASEIDYNISLVKAIPSTGESTSVVFFTLLAFASLSSIGLIVSKRRIGNK